MSLENAILEALVYSDIFEYPLTAGELHRFLIKPASRHAVEECAAGMKDVNCRAGYYYLAGRGEIVEIRKRREDASHEVLKRAIVYGHILAAFPFIRMVAVTGSLAVLNLSKNPDMDFMLVTAHGRVWTARAFAIILGRIARFFGDTMCPNIIVSERMLAWPLHDLYSARELCQMVPIAGNDVYLRLFAANAWVGSFLPNANPVPAAILSDEKKSRLNIFESLLQTKIGSGLESWEMTRKIARFSKQAGFGEETVFTADVCQGNFHHHRKWTEDLYKDRLSALGLLFERREQAPAILGDELPSSKVKSAEVLSR